MRKYAWNIIAVFLMLLMLLSACERPEEPGTSAPSTSESTVSTSEGTASTDDTTEQTQNITLSPTHDPQNTEHAVQPSEPDDATAPSHPDPTADAHTHPTDQPTQPPEPSQNTAPTEPDEPTVPDVPTVPPTEPTTPTQPTTPTEPSTPTEPVAPSVPTAPTAPAPTEPEVTEPPTEPEETVPPTEPEETVPPTEPEQTEPEEDYLETYYLDQNGQFVDEGDPAAAKKLVVQYDTQWNPLRRETSIIATGILVQEEFYTYHEDGTYTYLSYEYHEDGSFYYGMEFLHEASGLPLKEITYTAKDQVESTTVYTYHSNGNMATKISEGPGTAKSSESYRENGTLIRSESTASDGFVSIRESNEAGVDTYCFAQFPDGSSSEQTWNDAGVLISDISVWSDGGKYICYYNDAGQITSRQELDPNGESLGHGTWRYNDEGKLYYYIFSSPGADSLEEWYNDAGIVIKTRLIDGDTGDSTESYFDDNGNQTGYSKGYSEGLLIVIDHYNMNDQLIKKERHEVFNYTVTEYNEAGEPTVTYYYDKDDNLIKTEYH